ncbi:uncharacterized protein VB005_01887 [Metarhizium brunneum]
MSNKDGSNLHERDELQPEHLNIKVTDNSPMVFKVKRSTKLEKLMNAFWDRQGKSPTLCDSYLRVRACLSRLEARRMASGTVASHRGV